MASKFKVGDKVHHFAKGYGTIVSIIKDSTDYPLIVDFCRAEASCFTLDGRQYKDEEPSLRLTGRPFKEGDRVVIGGQKFVIDGVLPDALFPASVRARTNDDEIWLTPDGRAWPNTPIICEHDWEQEGEDDKQDLAEGTSVAETQEVSAKAAESTGDDCTEQQTPKYLKMALALEGIEVDLKTADLIREIVNAVAAFGGQYSISHSCEIRQSIEQKYAGGITV